MVREPAGGEQGRSAREAGGKQVRNGRLRESNAEKVSGETIASGAGEVSGMIRMEYNPHT